MKKISLPAALRKGWPIALLLLTQQCMMPPPYELQEYQQVYHRGDTTTTNFLSRCDTSRLTCIIVHATAYHAVAAQTDDTPNITACLDTIDLNNPAKHRYLALSRDLYKYASCGDTVYLFNGETSATTKAYIVSDKMNKRFKKRVDVLVGRKDKTFSKKMAFCYCKNQIK